MQPPARLHPAGVGQPLQGLNFIGMNTSITVVPYYHSANGGPKLRDAAQRPAQLTTPRFKRARLSRRRAGRHRQAQRIR